MSKRQQPSPSHRTAHSGDHESSFESVTKALHRGAIDSKPRQARGPYNKAVVLGLRWSNDDLDLAKPQDALLETFRIQCGFETASLLIPSTSSEEALDAISETIFELSQRYDMDREVTWDRSTLFVIHYIGHGVSETEWEFDICGTRRPDAVRIPWSSIHLGRKSDVLVLIDTSYSGEFRQPCHSLQKILQNKDHHEEYLFATGNESPDYNGPNYDVNNNFTTRLTNLLYTASPAPVTVVQLHEALCTQANDPNTKLRYTPQYVDCRKPSIIIQHIDNYIWTVENPTSKAQIPTGRALISVSIPRNTIPGQVREWQASLSTIDSTVTIEVSHTRGTNS
ncbi:Pc12g14570 [Penicillium rubens Wisconsin 54-1255]|uniref:Pc12g14570 protein n=1 Tax=Penicillium rubens (strain ATCC 28089 / DSM 1075 / NRRL 1951 / Wisconsin 54-1255) TaxID=500485 RepID=B6H128_PENRW|nr:Pc12g14570 [Penicillium rubens Wisconsin 54-1255]